MNIAVEAKKGVKNLSLHSCSMYGIADNNFPNENLNKSNDRICQIKSLGRKGTRKHIFRYNIISLRFATACGSSPKLNSI